MEFEQQTGGEDRDEHLGCDRVSAGHLGVLKQPKLGRSAPTAMAHQQHREIRIAGVAPLHRQPLHGSPPSTRRPGNQTGCIEQWTSGRGLSALADTSDDLFTASLDLLFGRHEAVDEQAEKSNVHADEEHHVHGLVAT